MKPDLQRLPQPWMTEGPAAEVMRALTAEGDAARFVGGCVRDALVGRKIRDGELRKIPYMLVVGDREAEQDEVSVREHRAGDTGAVSVDAFAQRVREETKRRLTG